MLTRLRDDPFAQAALAQWAFGIAWMVLRLRGGAEPPPGSVAAAPEVRHGLAGILAAGMPLLAWWRMRPVVRLEAVLLACVAVFIAIREHARPGDAHALARWCVGATAIVAAVLLARAAWATTDVNPATGEGGPS